MAVRTVFVFGADILLGTACTVSADTVVSALGVGCTFFASAGFRVADRLGISAAVIIGTLVDAFPVIGTDSAFTAFVIGRIAFFADAPVIADGIGDVGAAAVVGAFGNTCTGFGADFSVTAFVIGGIAFFTFACFCIADRHID